MVHNVAELIDRCLKVGFTDVTGMSHTGVAELVLRSSDGRTDIYFNDLEDNDVRVVRYEDVSENRQRRVRWEAIFTDSTPAPVIFWVSRSEEKM